jgi:hypothetical protein
LYQGITNIFQKDNTMPNPLELIAEATASSGRKPYITEGTYPIVQVAKAEYKDNRKGETIVVTEFDVLQSFNTEVPPGTRISWVTNLTKQASNGAGQNIKDFLMGVTGQEAEDLSDPKVIGTLLSDNAIVGLCVGLQAFDNEAKTFTKKAWTTLDDEMQSKVPEIRKKLDLPSQIAA